MATKRWKIIADDLSGACDAAVAFSMRGLGVEVLLDWTEEGSAARDVIAMSTESRDVLPDEAVRRLRVAMGDAELRNFDLVFKKIDSVFRGNTVAEIVAAAEISSADLVVIAPAYPALGRACWGGVVEVKEWRGVRSIGLLGELRKSGLRVEGFSGGAGVDGLSARLRAGLARGMRCVVCDAVTQKDMEELAEAGMSLGVRVLWIGSGGLAHALAGVGAGEMRTVHDRAVNDGAVVCVVGSDHAVTAGQLEELHAETGLIARGIEDVDADWDGALVLRIGRDTAEAHVQKVFAAVGANDISCLVMTGGDTAMLVCKALGMRAIELGDEFAPGLPMGTAVGGRLDGCRVMLKSGGFGEADVLCRVFEKFGSRKESVA